MRVGQTKTEGQTKIRIKCFGDCGRKLPIPSFGGTKHPANANRYGRRWACKECEAKKKANKNLGKPPPELPLVPPLPLEPLPEPSPEPPGEQNGPLLAVETTRPEPSPEPSPKMIKCTRRVHPDCKGEYPDDDNKFKHFRYRSDRRSKIMQPCRLCRTWMRKKAKAARAEGKETAEEEAARLRAASDQAVKRNLKKQQEIKQKKYKHINEAFNLSEVVRALAEGRLVGDTPRAVNHALMMIIESQLHLLYDPSITLLQNQLDWARVALRPRLSTIKQTLSQLPQLAKSYVNRYKVGEAIVNGLIDNQLTRFDNLQILGIEYIDAPFTEIKARYHELSRQVHPDLAGVDSNERMQQINAAFEYLKKDEETWERKRKS